MAETDTTTFAPTPPVAPPPFGSVSPEPAKPSFLDPPKPAGSPNFDAGQNPPVSPPLSGTQAGFNQPGGEPVKRGFNAPPKPVEDPPDTKEQHFEAIRYLIDQLKTTTDLPTKATLENISTRLDEIEDKKPEKTVKW